MIYDAATLATATGGRLVHDGAAGPIGTDSRRLRQGDWFVALSGDRFDGHAFLPHAAAAGCAGVVAREVPEGWSTGFVAVEDGLQALQDIARSTRKDFHGPVVGLTGSAGKTTTRAMVGLVLEALGPVHQTQGNLNNHIGLPLTIVDAPVDAATWVLEMGMSGFGEIHLLQEIGAPTVRLITNVGPAHLDGVGSLEGVARAKGELFAGARPGDICLVYQDDPRVAAIPLPEGVRVLRYGESQGCHVRLTDAVVDAETLATRVRMETPRGTVHALIPSPGLHLAVNAAAAVAVGIALRVPVETMGPALGRYAPVGMRQRIEDGPGGIRVINDAYNANPISVGASLRTLAAVSGTRRVALLGDMLELGDQEESAHLEALQLAGSLGLDLVATAGPRFAAAAASLARSTGVAPILTAPDAESLGRAVGALLREGDLVLLKGSRGIAMERVMQTITADDSRSGEEA